MIATMIKLIALISSYITVWLKLLQPGGLRAIAAEIFYCEKRCHCGIDGLSPLQKADEKSLSVILINKSMENTLSRLIPITDSSVGNDTETN